MKNLRRMSLLICVLLLGTCNISFAKEEPPAGTSLEDRHQYMYDVDKEFLEVQDKINAIIHQENGQYVFDEAEVRKVIQDADLDYDVYNSMHRTNYTEQSFGDAIIESLKTTTDGKWMPASENTGAAETAAEKKEVGAFPFPSLSKLGWAFLWALPLLLFGSLLYLILHAVLRAINKQMWGVVENPVQRCVEHWLRNYLFLVVLLWMTL